MPQSTALPSMVTGLFASRRAISATRFSACDLSCSARFIASERAITSTLCISPAWSFSSSKRVIALAISSFDDSVRNRHFNVNVDVLTHTVSYCVSSATLKSTEPFLAMLVLAILMAADIERAFLLKHLQNSPFM